MKDDKELSPSLSYYDARRIEKKISRIWVGS